MGSFLKKDKEGKNTFFSKKKGEEIIIRLVIYNHLRNNSR